MKSTTELNEVPGNTTLREMFEAGGGEGTSLFDDAVTRESPRPVKSSGIWSAIWGTLAALPTGFTSVYDWCAAKIKAIEGSLSGLDKSKLDADKGLNFAPSKYSEGNAVEIVNGWWLAVIGGFGKIWDVTSDGVMRQSLSSALNGKADKATTLAGYGITDAATKAEIADKADLVGGKVPAAQLPSYVDDVLEYDTVSAFPATGESGKIYVAKDTSLVYRWSGTQYVEISPSPVLDDTVTETSSNGVKSSGVWSWVKSLLPKWLTSDYAEPATVKSVATKADKATTLAGYGITDAVPFVKDVNGNKTAVTIGIAGDSGQDSLANGEGVTASGNRSHAEGNGTTAYGENSHAEGISATAYESGSHAEGSLASAYGYCSHAEGGSTTASGYCSHAEGEGTTASGNYSHSEGSATTASGGYSHAEGSGTTAAGMGSHAEGSNTTASGTGSHTDGINSQTRSGDQFAFAWNGDDERANPYTSNGPGTFNINPAGGLNGFYIGEQTLHAILTNKADKATTYTKSETDAKIGGKRGLTDAAVWEKTWDFSWCSPSFKEFNWRIEIPQSPDQIGTLFDGDIAIANVDVDDRTDPRIAEIVYVFENLPPYYTAPEGSGCGIEVGKRFDAITSKLSRSFVHSPDATTSGIAAFDGKGKLKTATAGTDYQEPLSRDQLKNISDIPKKAGKVTHPTAGNLAALMADGDLADSGKKPSDFRETTDNTCHKTTSVAGEWSTVTKDGDIWSVYSLDASGQREWVLRCNGTYYPNASTKDVGDDTATSLTWVRGYDWDKDFDITFTRTFTTLASKDHTFVTEDNAARSLECGEGDAKQTVTVENGVAKLNDFFTESNSLLTGTIDARLPYPLNAVTDKTGLLKDRAINTTSLASVTVPDNFTDLLIRASVASSLSVTMPAAITKYGDTFPGEAGEYLITITKTGAAEAYVRTIKLEEVANA